VWVPLADGAAVALTAGRSVFALEFVDQTGRRRREALPACLNVAFEDVSPVRGFRWSKGMASFAGWWWSATMDRHVGFESWLERDHEMFLDFDLDVVAFAAQPFWLHWPGEDRGRRHAPDFFARRGDGTGVVIDVRPEGRIEAADAEAFAATARACLEVGWTFRRVGVPDPVLVANVRWLSRYRHPRCGAQRAVAERLVAAFARPRPLFEGACEVGDRLAVLPVLYHLLWCQMLVADLAGGVLHAATLVWCRDEGRR
jgi:hypothetical protein